LGNVLAKKTTEKGAKKEKESRSPIVAELFMPCRLKEKSGLRSSEVVVGQGLGSKREKKGKAKTPN